MENNQPKAPTDQMADKVASIVFGGVAFAVYLSTFNNEWFPIIDPDDAETLLVPRVLLLCLIALSGLLFARSIFTKSRSPYPDLVDWRDFAAWGRLLVTLAVVIAISLSLRPVGFQLTMTVGVFVLGVVMGYRRWLPLISVAILAPTIARYVIVDIAELNLPASPGLQILGLD